jgi:glycerophosphoryl diester phosphodiesterase
MHLKLLVILAITVSMHPAVGQTRARCAAHRGDLKVAPENTLPALASAARKGAHMIEFDVQLSRDGQLVLMHDATVDRTTNGRGKVSELSFKQLRALDAGDWFAPKFARTRIPTLREALAAIPRGILLNVHLKNSPGVAVAATRNIADMRRVEDCFLACTSAQAAEAKAIAPRIRICNMSGQRSDTPAYAKETIALGSEFIQLLGPLNHLREAVDELHRYNVTVNYFGAQEAGLIRRLAEANVDYILTNDLDLCLSVLAEYGVKPGR